MYICRYVYAHTHIYIYICVDIYIICRYIYMEIYTVYIYSVFIITNANSTLYIVDINDRFSI